MKGKHTILLAERGSVTYGTDISEGESKQYGIELSDTDYMRIVMAPIQEVLSVRQLFEASNKTNPDEEIHELRHFLQLCAKANPNIIECLAVAEKNIVEITPEGQLLRDNIHLFLNRKPIFTSYMGYTQQQVRRYVERSVDRPVSGKRKEYWERFGYDVKAASHALRLLIQGTHVLRHGDLKVRLPKGERDLVKSVRLGQVSKEEALKLINSHIKGMEKAAEGSWLPERPDMEKIDELYRRLYIEKFSLPASVL